MVVFLHGSGQNGNNNADQIHANANGVLELGDSAIQQNLPLLFVAAQVENDYCQPRSVAAVIKPSRD